MTRYLKYAGAVVSVWLAAYGTGRFVGDWYSDWDNVDRVKRFILEHVVTGTNQQGRAVLTFSCGTRQYAYDPAADALLESEDITPLLAGVAGPRLDHVRVEILAAAIGIPAAKALPDVLEQMARVEGKGSAIVIAGTVLGFGLGLADGYRAEPECNASATRAAATDKAFWRELALHRDPPPAAQPLELQPLPRAVADQIGRSSSSVPAP